MLLRVLLTGFAGGGVIPISLAVRDSTATLMDPAALPVALVLLSLTATWLRMPVAVGLVLSLAGLVASVVIPNDGLEGAPRILLGYVGFLLVIEFRRRRVGILFSFIALLYVGLHLAAQPSHRWLGAVDDAVLSASLTLTGATFMTVLSGTLRRLDGVRARRVAQELDEAFREATARVLDDGRQLIHNEVIGTLSAVANYRGTDADRIREACGDVEKQLNGDTATTPRDGTSLSDLVADITGRSLVRVTVEPFDANPRLNAEQTVAIDRAISEGLRNVSKHSGVHAATIGWQSDDNSWHLHLTDSGTGTGPVSESLTGRWGVSNNLTEPLLSIGGSAEVRLTPGTGTVVALHWPIELPARAGLLEREHSETVRAMGGDTSLAVKVAVPVLAGNTWLALRYTWGDPTALTQLTLALAVVVVTMATVARLRRRPLPGWWLSTVAALAALAIAAGLSMSEPDALSGYDSWVIGLSSVVLTVTAFYVPSVWLLLLLGPPAAVVVVAAIASGLPIGATGGAINAIVVPVILGNGFGAYLRWTRATTDREELQIARVAQETHRRQVSASARAQELAHVRAKAGPWLLSVSTGQRSLEDPATRAEAQRLALEMRDELHLPGLLDPALRGKIERARRSGLDVELLAPNGPVLGAGPYLRMLDRALDLEGTLERVIVDLPRADRPHGEIVLLPPVENDPLAFVLRSVYTSTYTVLQDDLFTRIQLTHPVITRDEE